jgi:hypothetical protein
MPSTHKFVATIPCGDPDLGAEVDCEIVFSFVRGAPAQGPSYATGGQPADPDEVELVKTTRLVNGKRTPYTGAFAHLEQELLDLYAITWLATDDGQAAACEQVYDDDCAAREQAEELRAEELRAEMRRED